MERWEGLLGATGGVSGFLCGDLGEFDRALPQGDWPRPLTCPLACALVSAGKGKEVCLSNSRAGRGKRGLFMRESITTQSSLATICPLM